MLASAIDARSLSVAPALEAAGSSSFGIVVVSGVTGLSVSRPHSTMDNTRMVFSSIIFLFYFLPAFLIIFAGARFSKTTLLVFSLVFYAWGEPLNIVVLLVSITMNFMLGLAIERGRPSGKHRFWVTIGISANILSLVVFKYTNLLLETAIAALGAAHLPISLHITLPLGISFYTFHAVSYLVDVYRGDAPAERSLRDLAVYIAMFPQLIAGPIIRYKTISGELHRPLVTVDRTAEGIRLFVIGLSQKVLIANTVANPTDAIFGLPPSQLSSSLAWLGLVCYTLQIYFDFCGYSNMAIGLGRMIGFTYPTNFNYPYSAQSISEFWRRWHITLSSWFRDYLYVPLGGNRGSAIRTYRNLLIVFLLCGLWHGAAWTFVVWGLVHGAFLILERIAFGRALRAVPRPLRHGYTLLAVAGSWVLFRSPSLESAGSYYAALVVWGASATSAPPLHRFLHADVMLALAVGIVAAIPVGSRLVGWAARGLESAGAMLAGAAELSCMAILMLLVSMSLAAGAYNPFIYFRF